MTRAAALASVVVSLLGSPDARGEIIPGYRRIDWEGSVGVPGGIPNRTTVCSTISAATFGNGTTDATAEINNRISSCPPDQVVRLPAGTYRTSGPINMKSGVTLRGDGPLVTKIEFSGQGGGTTGGVIRFDGSASSSGTGIAITGGLSKGSTAIAMDASTIGEGDFLLIDQLNDGVVVTNIGYDNPSDVCTWCSRENGTRAFSQISKVLAKLSGSVTIDPPLHAAYDPGLSPQAVRLGPSSSFITRAGVEDLQYEETNATPSNQQAMYWDDVAESWLSNVFSADTGSRSLMEATHVWRSEVRDSHFRSVWVAPAATNAGYGLTIGSSTTGLLIENNILEHSSAPLIFAWGASGNVASYNYFVDAFGTGGETSLVPSIQNHGAYVKMVLVEGNHGLKYGSDYTWGTHGYGTLFRNYFSGYEAPPAQQFTGSRWVVKIDKGSHGFNVVGNVLGDPTVAWTAYELQNASPSGCWENPVIFQTGYRYDNCSTSGWSAGAFDSLLRHGNYDVYSDSVHWCGDPGEPGCQGGDGSRTIPSSLYLSSRPSWWCTEAPWPDIGSDLPTKVSSIPAKLRHEGKPCTLGAPRAPSAPRGLVVL